MASDAPSLFHCGFLPFILTICKRGTNFTSFLLIPQDYLLFFMTCYFNTKFVNLPQRLTCRISKQGRLLRHNPSGLQSPFLN